MKIFFKCSKFFSIVFKYTKMSFMYIITNLFKNSCKILLMIFYNVVDAFVNSNDIIKYSNNSYLILNIVFYSSFFYFK